MTQRILDELAQVRAWKDYGYSWHEIAEQYNEKYGTHKTSEACRHWYNRHKDKMQYVSDVPKVEQVEPVVKVEQVSQKEMDIADLAKEFISVYTLADTLDVSPRRVEEMLAEAEGAGYEVVRENNEVQVKKPEVRPQVTELEESVLQAIKKGRTSLASLSSFLDRGIEQIESAIYNLQGYGYAVELQKFDDDGHVGVRKELERGGSHEVVVDGKEIVIGVVSDTHLYSKYADVELLHKAYDMFESEGITDVYHAGNILEGEARFNRFELVGPAGFESQVKYTVENYPQRKGIVTHFICGDDHEGWTTRDYGLDVGVRILQASKDAGRNDLDYMGYFSADVVFKQPGGSATAQVVHPGGGSAYSLSYKPQKYVESIPVDSRPDVVFMGHYHKCGTFEPEGTYVVLSGTFQWQSLFLKKQNIRSDVGWYIVRMRQAEDGKIVRFMPERIKPHRRMPIIYGP